MTSEQSARVAAPLVAHVIYNMRAGGLENGLVNLLNNLPEPRYRHVVVCVKDYSDFRLRVRRDDVEFIALNRREGKDVAIYSTFYRLFRRLRPAVVHSRNLAGLESLWPAYLAGVPCRIQAEHGRDMDDLDGTNRKYRLLRRLHSPAVNRFVAVSRDLETYLTEEIRIPRSRISQIYNGVDTSRFESHSGSRSELPGSGFVGNNLFIMGSVSRLQAVKDPLNLARAFALLHAISPELSGRLRLVICGDGPLLDEVHEVLAAGNVLQYAWLPGFVEDIPAILRGLDLFVLPSLAEGISNTILEAMSASLPVVATAVGGNLEIVANGETGTLVPANDPQSLAAAILSYVRDPDLARLHGRSGRARVDARYSLDVMVHHYDSLYSDLLAVAGDAN